MPQLGIDFEREVIKWAKLIFEVTKTKEQGKIDKEALQFNVNWKYVNFDHTEPIYDDVTKPTEPKSQVLFRTYFTNNTDQGQEYSFKTERTTNSACDIEIEKGVCYGEEMFVTLKTPMEIVESNVGFTRELSLRNSTTQSIEEQLTWSVDSQIKVPRHCKTTAELVITEDGYQSSFKIKSKVSGRVVVTLTNLRDNNSFVTVMENPIAEIISQALENGLRGSVSVRNNVVHVTTEGKCAFRYGVEQHVKLSQVKLENGVEYITAK